MPEYYTGYQIGYEEGHTSGRSDGREEATEEMLADMPQQMVKAFMLKNGQKMFSFPEIASDEVMALRIALIREEWEKELLPALYAGDLIEIADGLADLVYVAYGAALAYGIDLDAVIREVHASNMSKTGKDANGKVSRGPDYFKPRIAKVLTEQGALVKEND